MCIVREASFVPRFLVFSIFALDLAAGNVCAATVDLSAAGGDRKVDLSWTVAGSLRGIQVMRDTDSNPSGRQRVATLGGGARGYTDNAVVNGQQYWYWIKYTDAAKNTGNSNAASAAPAASPPPPDKGNTGATCSNPVALTLPKVFTGAADTCLVTSGNIDNVNSWGAEIVEINGVSYNSQWSNQMPARINGNYYIRYLAKQVWAHFEINGNNGNSQNVAVSGVTVTPTKAALSAGSTTSLVANVAPGNASNKNLSWSSSNTKVATVNANGLVTGLAAGSTIITVTTADGNHTATCTVTVPAIPNPTPVPTPSGGGIHISGSQVLERNGNSFVMRGINVPHAWYADKTASSLSDIAKTGANTVRIVLASGDRWTKTSESEVSSLIAQAKANKLIAILEVHDTTGYGEQAGAITLAQAANYWKSIKGALIGQEDYVIIDIGNEPLGNGPPASAWTNGHIEAIKSLRDAGLTHAIMVDAANWGQDWENITRNNAASVLAADPQRNVIFSVHMYQVYDKASTIDGYLSTFKNNGLALVVGEFAADHQGANVDEASIMSYAKQYGYGYLGWSWSGNSAGLESLDIARNFNASTLSPWGNTLINGNNGIKATSSIATIFGGSGNGGQ